MYQTIEPRYLFSDSIGRMSSCGMCAPQKCYRWSYLLSSLCNALILMSLTVSELYTSYDKNLIFTFNLIILLIGVFAGFFAFHGIVYEYQYEMYLHLVSMLMAITYCWIDYSQNRVESDIKLIRSIVASSLTIPSFLFCLCITCSESWREFYIVGTSEEFLNMYKNRRYLLCLLKFDLLAVGIIGIFSLAEINSPNTYNYIPLIIIVLYAISFWILVQYGVRHERPLPLFIFLFSSVTIPIWITYMFMNHSCLVEKCKGFEAAFNYSKLGAGIISVIVRQYVLIDTMKVFQNFDCGLSERAFRFLISPEYSTLLTRPRRGSL